jgi:hypothetical protein
MTMTFDRYTPQSPTQRYSDRMDRTAATMEAVRRAKKPSVSMEGGTRGARPKAPEPVSDEAYRRLVASLPCFECGIQGYSQAAHPNSGKGKGKKLSDRECFPMCCARTGVKGCHQKFDEYEIVSAADMPDYELRAAAWTRDRLRAELGAKA